MTLWGNTFSGLIMALQVAAAASYAWDRQWKTAGVFLGYACINYLITPWGVK